MKDGRLGVVAEVERGFEPTTRLDHASIDSVVTDKHSIRRVSRAKPIDNVGEFVD